MEYKHAKEIIEVMCDYLEVEGISINEEKALQLSMDVLDKQIPKAMEYDEDDLNICPECGLHINTDDGYCKHCGQAIYYDINKEK